eukprot:1943756-Ditylum_brightwellii.AAC.1
MQTCPVCKQHKETFGHLQCCPKNKEKWDKLIPELTNIYNHHIIDPVLRIIINMFVKNPAIVFTTVQTQHPLIDFQEYADLMTAQQIIGWKQLRYGQWSMLWANYQWRHNEHTKIESQGYPAWMNQIIKVVWMFQKRRWHYRNKCLHNNTQDTTKRTLLLCITGLYAKQDILQV